MSFDFSTLFWIFIAITLLQPLFAARWYAVRRAQAIRAVEKLHGSRVITMIHRQEKRSLFGFSVARHIDLEDAQTIIAAIKDTPEDMPIDFVIHTPGGLVLAAMQIARAVEAHKAKVTVYVPVYAMSGGTLIALAANEIVLGEFSVLGPIDPQIAGLPAASIVKARDSKPVDSVFDLTLVLADVAEKALVQVKQGARSSKGRDRVDPVSPHFTAIRLSSPIDSRPASDTIRTWASTGVSWRIRAGRPRRKRLPGAARLTPKCLKTPNA
jgi:ClpP class serine protease